MDLQKALDETVIGLFRGKNSAFLSSLYCSMHFKWDSSIPTACTNGKEIIWNPAWFASLSKAMRVTVLAHELWHTAFMHALRMGHRVYHIWLMAADYSINNMLEEHGYVFDKYPVGHPQEEKVIGLLDPRFKDMSVEAIYDVLLSENISVELPFGEDFQSSAKNPEATSPEEINELLSVILRAHTMQQLSGTPGNMPGEFLELIDHLINPTVPWETALQRWLTERSDRGYNMARPNRRYQDIYLPSRGGEEGLAHLLWAIDTSGSMTPEMLIAINSEIAGAKDSLSPELMTIVAFDTEIQDTWEFTSEMEMKPLEMHGRGGTDMDELFKYALKLQPQAMIIFSDMYCSYPPEIPGISVCWACLDRPGWEPPYGSVIHIDTTRASGA